MTDKNKHMGGMTLIKKFYKPSKDDWLRVTFDDKEHICRDWDFVIKLAKRKNKNKKGDYYLESGGKVIFCERKVIATWKHERFSDEACTKRVKV